MPKYIVFWLIALITLAACTQSTARTGADATRLPSMTPIVAPTLAATATLAPATPVLTSATATVNLDTQAGTTAEGYHTVGSAQAPVTMVDYSDFF